MYQIDPRSINEFFAKLREFTALIAVVLLAIFLLFRLSGVVTIILLSLMLTATLTPISKALQKKLSKHFSVTIIISAVLLSIVGFLALTVPPVVNQAGNLIKKLPENSLRIEKSLGKFGPAYHRMANKWTKPSAAVEVAPQTLQSIATPVLGFIANLATVLLMTTYLLADGGRVATTLTGLFPKECRLLLRRFFGEIGEQMGDYIRGQVITSALAGAFTAVFLFVLGVPEPLALAGLMAIADAVPIVGIFIGTVPAVMMALTKSPGTAFIVLVGYLLYHALESYVIVPRIYGKMMKMPAVAILLAILIGSSLWGIIGALFALPVAAAIPTIIRYWSEWQDQQESSSSSPATAA
ncbi:MAG: AI-2E family transporter [Armatimonas sp.]